jgi:predicted Zn-dependent peptidase
MKKMALVLIACVIPLLFVYSSASDIVSPGSQVIEKMTFPAIDWQVPKVGEQVARLVLPNGLILYLMEDHELPIVNANAMIRTGSIYDPKDKMAIAGITGSVMRTGGTRSFSPDSLNSLLEFISASVESNIGTESGSASMSVLSKDLDIGLRILYEVLRYPSFDTAKISLEKSQIRDGIRRRNDRPGEITGREFSHLIYGEHPYGRILEWAEVKNISRDDLVAYHEKYYHPNNIMIAFSGDFDKNALLQKIEKAFGDWPKADIQFPPIPEVEYKSNPGVFVIPKNLTQANINVGHLGIKRDNPDRYAVALMNFTLGGGSFTSRLTSRVRSDEGLAYSVGSSFATTSRDYGVFLAYAQTKTNSTYRVLQIFTEEFEKIRRELASEREFETARDAYINNFVFQFDSPEKVVNRLMSLEYDNYPSDYYQKYLDNIRAVTIEDMRRVADKYLRPDDFTILVLADTSKISGDLRDFGAVKYIQLQEPKID